MLSILIAGSSLGQTPVNAPEVPIADLASGEVIDLHIHAAGVGAGGSGAFISESMKGNFRYDVYLLAMGVTEDELDEFGDAIGIRRISENLADSKLVSRGVVLALDGVIDADGELDREQTQVYVPNDFVSRETARYANLLFGASVNPNRPDAIERLEGASAQGAVLVKWIPSIMGIDPADPKHTAFYRKLVELELPLLTHTGMERAFPNARDELADPQRLVLPLSLGVRVIAAHIATTGQSEGQDNFERILPMFAQYPNLYADISSLTQINKLGYLKRALATPGIPERLLYGTDWPLTFFPMVSPWYHVADIDLEDAARIGQMESSWDQDVMLKQTLGTPQEVFTRASGLLPIRQRAVSPRRPNSGS